MEYLIRVPRLCTIRKHYLPSGRVCLINWLGFCLSPPHFVLKVTKQLYDPIIAFHVKFCCSLHVVCLLLLLTFSLRRVYV